ncbi:hypothetical protein CGLO_03049 [Colletotrichum gloeosporioides Cg-14]|uniref:Uncharacterized protein n=1 Tax=Colletotrichum gloeosporioides (strain Cg-14) TaxID=1237896 RepID=T0KXG6_COLGC|nr:hypothetical protein CGLO_03049 [Colletotrichum gloeosporioides Cg-14]
MLTLSYTKKKLY